MSWIKLLCVALLSVYIQITSCHGGLKQGKLYSIVEHEVVADAISYYLVLLDSSKGFFFSLESFTQSLSKLNVQNSE